MRIKGCMGWVDKIILFVLFLFFLHKVSLML